jgi:hypothetical protein
MRMSSFFFPTPKTLSLTEKDYALLEEISDVLRYILLGFCYYREISGKRFVWAPNCHGMVRGIASICPHIEYASGFFWGFEKNVQDEIEWVQMEHSWFKTPDGAIIDPYPMQAHTRSEILLIPTSGPTAPFGGNQYEEHGGKRMEFEQVGIWQQARKAVELYRLGITRERHLHLASCQDPS